MKTKILTSLSLKVLFDDGYYFVRDFKEKLGMFAKSSDEPVMCHDLERMMQVKGITKEGKIVLSYIFDGDYEPRLFFFEIGETLKIEDHFEVYGPGSKKQMRHVSLLIESKGKEVELDEDNLVLLMRESASSGPDFICGEKEKEIKVQKGLKFESDLLRKKQQCFTIKNIDWPCITLDVEGKEKIITPWVLFYQYQQGGYNSPNDYESFERFLTIRLHIPEAIQVVDRR